jgi:hypothetical protein
MPLLVSFSNCIFKCKVEIVLFKLCLFFRNNECPACRTHCASRRSLRDDPKYDTLIAAMYPDIEKYEEEVPAYSSDFVVECI